MQPIVIRSSRRKMLGYLGLALAFGVIGAVLWRMDSSSPYAWLGIILFVFGAYASGRQLLNSRPRITIDDNGIVDRTLRYGLIEWNDIEGAYVKRKATVGFVATFICLQLRDTKKYTDRLPPTARRLVAHNSRPGATPVSLNLIGVDVEPEEILSVIDKQVRAHAGARPGVTRS